jgi:hypothetical protein
LKREREEEQRASPLWVTGELGSPTVKPPPDTRSPEGGGGEMDLVGRNKHPAFSLAPFLSKRYISMPRTASSLFSILDPTLSGDETKSPTRGSLRRCPDNGENAGSNQGDVSTGGGMVATLSGTANTKPLVGYWSAFPSWCRLLKGIPVVHFLIRKLAGVEVPVVRRSVSVKERY